MKIYRDPLLKKCNHPSGHLLGGDHTSYKHPSATLIFDISSSILLDGPYLDKKGASWGQIHNEMCVAETGIRTSIIMLPKNAGAFKEQIGSINILL